MSTSNNTPVSQLDARKWLSKRPLITSTQKRTVKVLNCNDFHKVSADGKTTTVAIANFDCFTVFQAETAKEALLAGDTNKALNQCMSLGIRSTDYRPAKGEIVNVQIDSILNKDGIEILVVTSVMEIKAVTTKTFVDFSLDADLVSETEDVTSMD